MGYLYTIIRFLLRFLEGFLIFALCYFLSAFWLPFCTVNGDFIQPKQGVEIFIESNGVHTDFLLPVKSKQKNWFTEFPVNDFQAVDTTFNYVAIGWGDRGFYLYTATWADLTFSTAFKAAFALDSAAMHVTYEHIHPVHGEWTKRLVISEAQYEQLIAYIHSGFKKRRGLLWPIAGHTYGVTDCFYEGSGNYSLFKTCNVWTNDGLKTIGVRTGFWCPSEDGIRRRF
ncbi:MAG TPA: TIGR02117 family protein [Bacteroidia bacterium]|nr:TIGR02117 family protein [Bacteroidia bacterium]